MSRLEKRLVACFEYAAVDVQRHLDQALAVVVRTLAGELDQPLRVGSGTARSLALVRASSYQVVIRSVHGTPLG